MILRRFLLGAAIVAVLLPLAAGRVSADAASYIRALFDATIRGSEPECANFLPVAQFAAGQHWPHFDATERAAFEQGFCDLALEALARLRLRYPDLSLTLTGGHAGPNETFWVRSRAFAGGRKYPVDWLVDDTGGTRRVGDLKVMGISMAIFLRSLAANAQAGVPEAVLRPWRRAVDLALPEAP